MQSYTFRYVCLCIYIIVNYTYTFYCINYMSNIICICMYNTYIHPSIHPYIPTYLPTYLHTYIPTYLHTYIPTITYIL